MLYSKDNYSATLRRIIKNSTRSATVALAKRVLREYEAKKVSADEFIQVCCLYCNERDESGGYSPAAVLGDLLIDYTNFDYE